MGNEGLCSVGKEWEKSNSKKQQAVSFAGHSRLGLNHKSLAKSNLPMTLQIPARASHVACFVGQQSRVNYKSSRETTYSQILHQTLTHNPFN